MREEWKEGRKGVKQKDKMGEAEMDRQRWKDLNQREISNKNI